MASDEIPRKNWITVVTFGSILVLLLVVNVAMTARYILAVLMGGVLAQVLVPFYRKLTAWRWNRKLSAGVMTLTAVLAIVGPLTTFSIIAVKEGVDIARNVAEEKTLSVASITSRIGDWKLVRILVGGDPATEEQFRGAVQDGAKIASVHIIAMAGRLPDRVLQIILAVISCFFFLLDGKRFLSWLNDRIPLDLDVRTKLYLSLKNTANSVLRASVAAAAAQAALMFVTFLGLGVPGAFLAGAATFILAWIPILGSAPVWISGAIYLLIQDRIPAFVFMLILGGITSVVDNYIRAWILKGREGLHPLVSLVAIFGGIAMFGIVGVFIGPVLAGVLVSLLETWPIVGKRFGLIFDSRM
jgi:predicted PurR-regulated permease PerM